MHALRTRIQACWLITLLVFVSLPRTWFHHHGEDHAHAGHFDATAAVGDDAHCDLCDALIAPADLAPLPRLCMPHRPVLALVAALPEPVGGRDLAAPGARGPPARL